MQKTLVFVLVLAAGLAQAAAAMADATGGDWIREWWSIDVGIHGFKTSAGPKPAEIGFNAVFERWENINQGASGYTVAEYNALEPLYFNMVFGLDVMVRYRKYFWFRLGYDYSNPFGIGGEGNIMYRAQSEDGTSADFHEESKSFQYTSHQISLFFGPAVPVAKDLAEVYLGFAPMAPTWVAYDEEYLHTVNGGILTSRDSYDMTLTGFFGSCRAVVGAQVRVWRGLKLGSELVSTFLNYMEVSSGKLSDSSFSFPSTTWNFTARYQVL